MIAQPASRRARGVARCALLSTILVAGACTGDFGRPRQGVWNDTLAPTLGFWAATSREESASPFRMTDDENQLRDRAWRFVMPANERNHFERLVSGFAHARILPVEAQSRSVSDYHNALVSGSFASQASRYARLAEDAGADRLLIAPFRANAGRVVAADRARLRTVQASPLVPPEQVDPAFARVIENEGLILWVCERLGFRLENYRYSLTNLVVEMPSQEAVRAERAIMALEADAGLLCKIPLIGMFGGARGGVAIERAIPARPAGPGLVLKD